MERTGWTEEELQAMTLAERQRLFGEFDDAPELAAHARRILEASRGNH